VVEGGGDQPKRAQVVDIFLSLRVWNGIELRSFFGVRPSVTGKWPFPKSSKNFALHNRRTRCSTRTLFNRKAQRLLLTSTYDWGENGSFLVAYI